MATIGTLSISVQAKTKKFERAMKRASRRIKKFSESISQSALKITKFGTALGAVALIGLSLMVRKQLEVIDATAKLSERIGIATEDLLKLRFAAKITGSSSEALDKSLEQLTKRLGEASQGLGTGKDGLKALDIELKDIINLNPAEQFKLIADAMAAMSNQAERNAATTQLFGRSGQSLVNTLALGRKGIEKLGDQLVKLGGAFTEIDASKVEAANDALTRMETLFTGIFQRITIEFAPIIETITNRIVKFGTEGEGVAKKIQKEFKKIVDVIIEMSSFIDLAKEKLLLLAAASQRSAEDVARIIKIIGRIATLGLTSFIDEGLGEDSRKAAEKLEVMAIKAREAFDTSKRGRELAISLQEILNNADAAAKKVKKLNEETNKLTGGKIKAQFEAQIKLLKEGTRLNEANRTLTEKFLDREIRLTLLLKKKVITQRTFNAEVRKAAEPLLEPMLKREAKAAKELKKILEKLAEEAKNKFEDLKNRAIAIFDRTRTPIERIKKEMEDLKILFNTFGSGLKKDTFDREMKRLKAALKEATQDPLTDFAKGLIEQTKTPLERFKEQMKKIADAFNKNLFSREVFNRAKKDAEEALKSATKTPSIIGSAREVILSRISVSGFGQSRNKEQRVFDPQISVTNKILTKIERKLFNQPGVPVVQ